MRKNVKKIEAVCVAVGITLLVIIIAALFNVAKNLNKHLQEYFREVI